jgi:hypothetical protein
MAERYTDKIAAYCEQGGVEIPAGFHRHPASRYVAIDIGASPPRLIAKTWFKQEDVVYYLAHLAQGRQLRLLDFKERQELQYVSSGKLVREKEF